jgi:hypothetical protein
MVSKEDAFTVLREWENRGRSLDAPSYIQTLAGLLPQLTENQVDFLWDRAISESRNEDHERKWFGEISLYTIALHLYKLTKHKRLSLLEKLNFTSFKNKKAAASLMFMKSVLLDKSDRVKLQKEAWEYAAPHCNDPLENSSDSSAHTLEWSNNDAKRMWIDTLIPDFDLDAAWSLWKDYVLKAEAGILELDEYNKTHTQIIFLAKILPAEYVKEALTDQKVFVEKIEPKFNRYKIFVTDLRTILEAPRT